MEGWHDPRHSPLSRGRSSLVPSSDCRWARDEGPSRTRQAHLSQTNIEERGVRRVLRRRCLRCRTVGGRGGGGAGELCRREVRAVYLKVKMVNSVPHHFRVRVRIV